MELVCLSEFPALRVPDNAEKDCLRAIASHAVAESFGVEDYEFRGVEWNPDPEYPEATRVTVDFGNGAGWDMSFAYTSAGDVVVYVRHTDVPHAENRRNTAQGNFWAEYSDAWDLLR